MKERPILFSGEMVRAIFNGKTQTRRIVKPQPLWVADPGVPFKTQDANPTGIIKCPYGVPGDRLWVREAWQVCPADQCIAGEPQIVSEWNSAMRCVWRASVPSETHPDHPEWGKQRWRPSIHMPRWASRLTLEVTGVRAERLQDITEADAQAEGIVLADYPVSNIPAAAKGPYVYAYAQLWDRINGPGAWEANPWVWVYEFKPVEGSK